jgi:hypothetical protein
LREVVLLYSVHFLCGGAPLVSVEFHGSERR